MLLVYVSLIGYNHLLNIKYLKSWLYAEHKSEC